MTTINLRYTRIVLELKQSGYTSGYTMILCLNKK